MATTASALGASRSIHSVVLIGWPDFGIGAHRGPVALFLDALVGDGSLHHQHERIELALLRLVPGFEEGVAGLEREHRIMQMDLGQAGDRAEEHVFDARLGGGGDGHRVAVTAEAGGEPQDVDVRNRRGFLGDAPVGRHGSHRSSFGGWSQIASRWSGSDTTYDRVFIAAIGPAPARCYRGNPASGIGVSPMRIQAPCGAGRG